MVLNKSKEEASSSPRRVCIVGGGVAGLAAAWHLHTCDAPVTVQLFEAEAQLGGHAYTMTLPNGTEIDCGFMVFNPQNYPNMLEWFKALQVESEPSDMSLSVSLDGGKTVEWSSDGVSGLLANPMQALSPAFYSFLQDMLRFNATAADLLTLCPDDPRKSVSMGQYLQQHGYGSPFLSYYLLPMMAAIWSANAETVLDFPAVELISFLCNHKMLQLLDRPLWKTVKGRSQQYTAAVSDLLGDAAQTRAPVASVARQPNGTYHVVLANHNGSSNKSQPPLIFDDVIFACHPPTAAAILKKGKTTNPDLIEALARIAYADNEIYVHADPTLMPRSKAAWASWNCLGQSQDLTCFWDGRAKQKQKEAFEGAASGFGNTIDDMERVDGDDTNKELEEPRMKAVFVTYWLNRLQNLTCDEDIFISLNPRPLPDPSKTHAHFTWAHPQYTQETVQARATVLEHHQGVDGLWFCGAWAGYGFHEDGCRSGFEVATALTQVPLPWCRPEQRMVLAPPDLSKTQSSGVLGAWWRSLYKRVTRDWPIAVCKRFIFAFLQQAVQKGRLRLILNNGSVQSFGDGTPCGCGDQSPVTMRIFDDWFFVKTALEYDLGLARSYMAGYFTIQPLDEDESYHPVLKPADAQDETTVVLGDPIGLTRLFLLLIGNRDYTHAPRKAGRGYAYSNALTNASGLIISKIGSIANYLRYKLFMDNSERGGSLKNIHAHYDLSNDLFTSFLDKETLMYSSAIYDAVPAPSPSTGLVFRGSLEEAQWRKLDTLLQRAQVQPGQTVLDIGFGWGGLTIHAAKKYGCRVTGITLSVEQKALAEQRVKKEGLESLVTFEVCDYRTFCRRLENRGKFDRVLSCEMIEAVGHEHLGEFFWAVEQVLAHKGILVMEAITTPEQRYETYLRSTDFINTIIFPGSCCPSLHALVDAAYQQSCLTLEHIDNIGLHYAQTLAEWRRRFNANEELVRNLGFDDIFLRAWNYYLTYCEAGFFSQTENCLILVFARQGCSALAPLCETGSVTQPVPLTNEEIRNWVLA